MDTKLWYDNYFKSITIIITSAALQISYPVWKTIIEIYCQNFNYLLLWLKEKLMEDVLLIVSLLQARVFPRVKY